MRRLYTCLSIVLAATPMLPVYAGQQSTSSTNNTATPPEEVHKTVQELKVVGTITGVGVGALGLAALGLYGVGVQKGKFRSPHQFVKDKLGKSKVEGKVK
jgi:hypothetical protein